MRPWISRCLPVAVAAACGNADIDTPPDAAAATVPTVRRFPSGIVRYRLPDTLDPSERAAIHARVTALQAITPLHFIDTHGGATGDPLELRDSVLVDRVIARATLGALGTTPAEDVIAGRGTLSSEEVNRLWRAYGTAIGSSQSGDKFGAALAAADFNGDGYTDVAVGVPGDDIGAADAGRVHVFRGTRGGLVPWQSIEQSDFGGEDERGDGFGTTLAAGDIDADGAADLLVGVPREDVTVAGVTYVDSGAAVLLRGSASGFTLLRTFTQASSGAGDEHDNDLFGSAVAIGHVGGLTAPEVIIGAPGDEHPASFGGTAAAGAVYVWNTGGPETRATRLYQASNNGGARFGAAIAVGVLDDGAGEDLVIGAPGAGSDGRGAVFVYAGTTFAQRLTPPAAGTREFGAAVAIGDVRDGTSSEIVVGAPASAGNAGRVLVYASSGGGPGAITMHLAQTLEQIGGKHAGARFGVTLAISAYGEVPPGPSALVVGAPGSDDGAGVVAVFKAARRVEELAGVTVLAQGQLPGGKNEPYDWFGSALAIDGATGAIIAGAWGEAPELDEGGAQGPDNAGAIAVFEGERGVQYSQASETAAVARN